MVRFTRFSWRLAFAALVLAGANLGATPARAQDAAPPAVDVEVQLVTVAPMSSATAKLGDSVALSVAEDVVVGGEVIIPKGSSATGTVVFAKRKAVGGIPGALDINADFASVGDRQIKLRSHASGRGVNRVKVAALGGPFLFMSGRNVELPAGSPLLAYVASTRAPVTDLSGRPAWMPPPREDKALIIFFRAKDQRNPFLVRQKIKIDGEVVGTMRNNEYFYTYVDPGKHEIESSVDVVRLLTVEAGEEVYLRGAIVRGVFLTDTDPDLAQDLIAECKYGGEVASEPVGER